MKILTKKLSALILAGLVLAMIAGRPFVNAQYCDPNSCCCTGVEKVQTHADYNSFYAETIAKCCGSSESMSMTCEMGTDPIPEISLLACLSPSHFESKEISSLFEIIFYEDKPNNSSDNILTIDSSLFLSDTIPKYLQLQIFLC